MPSHIVNVHLGQVRSDPDNSVGLQVDFAIRGAMSLPVDDLKYAKSQKARSWWVAQALLIHTSNFVDLAAGLILMFFAELLCF
jgi:hypothetical protein